MQVSSTSSGTQRHYDTGAAGFEGGAGPYLVYPALHTEATDVYRLGCWARVRIDLGGFYFHLIFAVGNVGLY